MQFDIVNGIQQGQEKAINQNYLIFLTQNSLLLYEIVLSAFDKQLKFNFVKQIILSVQFGHEVSSQSTKLTQFIEIEGKEFDDDKVKKVNRSDILICDPY